MRERWFIITIFIFLLACSRAGAVSTRPGQESLRRDTWYELVLKQFNKGEFNYGAWLEERRRNFLAATVKNGYFWYSFTMTLACITLAIVYTKHRCDQRRIIWVACEFLADLYNDCLLAREQAELVTAKHNRHIEACNRAIEEAGSGAWKQSASSEELEEARKEIIRLRKLLDEKTCDHKRVSDELREKSETLAQLSLRVETLSKRLKGSSPIDPSSRPGQASQELIARINTLEQQLRLEQEKNRRLKGQ